MLLLLLLYIFCICGKGRDREIQRRSHDSFYMGWSHDFDLNLSSLRLIAII